jgi:LysM repeat protein
MAWDDNDIRGPGGIRYGVWIPRDPNYVKKEAPKAPEPPKALANDWIKIKVVDDQSGEVIPKVKLVLKTPDNSTEEHETRLSGLIESLGLQSGNCEVSCDLKDATKENKLSFVGVGEKPIGQKSSGTANQSAPAAPKPGTKYIASIEEHKVKTGETLESLAKSIGMTWQDLAKFNWGTTEKEKINKYLRWNVGCTKKPADGSNYIFDNSDDPGIVYLPKKWAKNGLPTNQAHIIRLQCLKITRSARIKICDHSGRAFSNVKYTLYLDEKQVSGVTDGSGWSEEFYIDGVKKGSLIVGGCSYDITFISDEIDGVRHAQLLLNHLGYNAGPLDGIVGRRTIDAICSFQKENKLKVTGKLDSDTMSKLEDGYQNL